MYDDDYFEVPSTNKELYERYDRFVRQVVRSENHYPSNFEDIVQEIWLKLISWDILAKFDRKIQGGAQPLAITGQEASNFLRLDWEVFCDHPLLVSIDGSKGLQSSYYTDGILQLQKILTYRTLTKRPLFMPGYSIAVLVGRPWHEIAGSVKPMNGGEVTQDKTYMVADVLPHIDRKKCKETLRSPKLHARKKYFENYLKNAVICRYRNWCRDHDIPEVLMPKTDDSGRPFEVEDSYDPVSCLEARETIHRFVGDSLFELAAKEDKSFYEVAVALGNSPEKAVAVLERLRQKYC